jgi:hypothetical protein
LSAGQEIVFCCSFSSPREGGSMVTHGPYRAYVCASPQYTPGRGIRKYKTALKNLIPIRKEARFV